MADAVTARTAWAPLRMADTEDMTQTGEELKRDALSDGVELGEIRDELPADLDPSQVTAPYLFPNNSRRKIPAVLYTVIGIGCLSCGQPRETARCS